MTELRPRRSFSSDLGVATVGRVDPSSDTPPERRLSAAGVTVRFMGSGSDAGKVRYTYRLRLSRTAEKALLAEWDRCRWVWNQCVEASTAAHRESMATGVKVDCGPALLDKRLTGWRGEHDWLADGSSVAQQQTIRDFGQARAKALKDRKDKTLSPRQRRGMPRFKSKHRALPSLNYTLRGFGLEGTLLKLAGAIVVRPVWSHVSCRPLRRACASTGVGPVVVLFRRPAPRNATADADWACDRDRLGRRGFGDHHQRRP